MSTSNTIGIVKAQPRVRQALLATAIAAALVAAATISTSLPSTAAVAPAGVGERSSFADLVESVKPAVVNISTRTRVEPDARLQLPPGSPMERQFREFFGRQFRSMPERDALGMGSGFIVDTSGYIVTNNHVIDGANEVTVTLHDGKQLGAKVIGRDPKTDLALIKVDTEETLTAVSFGDSNAARVGDWVVAVGNPFGLGGSVTAGIISARGRDIQSGPFDDFLQVDAPINRGNSGGPLFDTTGKVIGVNTAIFSPSGGNVGIGFAIPSAIASNVVQELRAHGRVDRGWMGVSIQAVTDDLADSFGLDEPRGALVASVSEGSPAAKAGIVPGDVILSFGGQAIDTMRTLPRVVAEAEADDNVPVTIWRGGAEKTLALTVGRMPQADAIAMAVDGGEVDDGARIGVMLAELDDERRHRLGLADDTDGVLITAVEPGSPAARRGLRAGDVILRAGDGSVASPDQVVDAVHEARKSNRKQLVLLVRRDGNERFVAVPFQKG